MLCLARSTRKNSQANRPTMDPLRRPPPLHVRLVYAVSSPSWENRYWACRLLEAIGPPPGSEPEILQCLRHPHPAVRAASALALGAVRTRQDATLHALLEQLIGYGWNPAGSRMTVDWALDHPRETLTSLIPLLETPKPEWEPLPAVIMQAIHDRVVPHLFELAKEGSDIERSWAAVYLGCPESIPLLVSKLNNGTSAEKLVALKAVEYMGKAGADAIDAIEACRTHADPQIRSAAVIALGVALEGDLRALPGLRRSCWDPIADVRDPAMVALARLGRRYPEAAAALRGCLEDAVSGISQSARVAIEEEADERNLATHPLQRDLVDRGLHDSCENYMAARDQEVASPRFVTDFLSAAGILSATIRQRLENWGMEGLHRDVVGTWPAWDVVYRPMINTMNLLELHQEIFQIEPPIPSPV